MSPALRCLLIRGMRQAEFTLRAPRASAAITARAIADRLQALRAETCAALLSFAMRLDDDSDTPCVDCGAPGGTHVSNPCQPGDRLGFVDRVSWERRRKPHPETAVSS